MINNKYIQDLNKKIGKLAAYEIAEIWGHIEREAKNIYQHARKQSLAAIVADTNSWKRIQELRRILFSDRTVKDSRNS
jgi:uncharacterized protein (UPF0305 family)